MSRQFVEARDALFDRRVLQIERTHAVNGEEVTVEAWRERAKRGRSETLVILLQLNCAGPFHLIAT